MDKIAKPTKLGKLERCHRTYDAERPRFKRHEQFIKHYHEKRAHTLLDYLTLAHVYERSITYLVR